MSRGVIWWTLLGAVCVVGGAAWIHPGAGVVVIGMLIIGAANIVRDNSLAKRQDPNKDLN